MEVQVVAQTLLERVQILEHPAQIRVRVAQIRVQGVVLVQTDRYRDKNRLPKLARR